MAGFVFPEITYEYDWNIMNPKEAGYLPTYEPDETKVRADLQRPLDQIKNTWNGELKTQMEGFCNTFGGLKPRGAYDSSVTYNPLDLVSYDGCTYVVRYGVTPFSNIAPDDDVTPNPWQLFAAGVAEAEGSVTPTGEVGVSVAVTTTAADLPKLVFTFTGVATSARVAAAEVEIAKRPIVAKGTLSISAVGSITLQPMTGHRVLSCSLRRVNEDGPYFLYSNGFTIHTEEDQNLHWGIPSGSLTIAPMAFGDTVEFSVLKSRYLGNYEYVALVDPDEMEVEST
jgi:hypothetical protein